MKRILALFALSLLLGGCCVKLDVPFVPFIAEPRLARDPAHALPAPASTEVLTSVPPR